MLAAVVIGQNLRSVSLNGMMRVPHRWNRKPNLTGPKTRAACGIVNRVLLIQEHGLNIATLVHLPAASEWLDSDDRHVKAVAFCAKQAYLFT